MFNSDNCDEKIFDEVLLTLGEFNHRNENTAEFDEQLTDTNSRNVHCQSSDSEIEKLTQNTIDILDSVDPFLPKNREFKIVDTESKKSRKRKFPGPAGLFGKDLNIDFNNDGDTIVLSQSDNPSQIHLLSFVFNEGPWCVMVEELKNRDINIKEHSISKLKSCISLKKLNGYRTKIIAGIIHNIDPNLHDPIVTIKDPTGDFQCILHREAWNTYSSYLIPLHSVLLLKDISILEVGRNIKNHYLNITSNNISTIFCNENILEMFNNGKSNVKNMNDSCFRLDVIDVIKWNSNNVIILRCFDKNMQYL